jgi:xanthine dehydrogenase/oxidase
MNSSPETRKNTYTATTNPTNQTSCEERRKFKMVKKSVTLYVNGVKREVREGSVDPKQSLLQYLREVGLTGTKLGCGEGGCGACTVMISHFDPTLSKPRHVSANACLVPLCSLDGYHVTTVEGIGGIRQGLHPVQKRLASLHGSQCGFCTPGIVMSLYTTLRNNPNATPHEIEESLDGNLCRCTGYRPILDAAKSLSNNKPSGCCGGGGGGGGSGGCPCLEGTSANGKPMMSTTTENTLQVIPSLADENHTEPIFPPDLFSYVHEEILVSNGSVSWYQPVNLESLLEYKQNYPNCKLIVGNTEVGIETQFKNFEYPILVNPCHVPELRVLRLEEEGIRVGASLSLEVLRNYIHHTFLASPSSASETPLVPHQRRGLVAIYHMLTWFASTQIRNVACLGGNLVTASPISDMNPMLSCLNAVLKLKSASGDRTILVKDFFRSYRQVNINGDEIVQDIFIPFTQRFEFVIPLKQARRREDDISIVTSGGWSLSLSLSLSFTFLSLLLLLDLMPSQE